MRAGTSALRLGDYNQQLVLELIRTEVATSRADIADQTGLTVQAISKIVRRLAESGLVTETVTRTPAPKAGRPPTSLRINPAATYALGVHIDRDDTFFVLLDLAGEVVGRDRRPTPQSGGPARSIEQVAEVTGRLVDQAGVPADRVLGLGVGAPGPIDPAEGVLYSPRGMRGWREVHLRELLEQRTKLDVTVEDLTIAAAIGERWTGKAQGVRNLLFVHVGWGVGAALLLDGQVYRGGSGLGGDLYHVPVDPAGPACDCGNRGCVGRYASSLAIVDAVRQRTGAAEVPAQRGRERARPAAEHAEVCRAALVGSPVEREVLVEAARMLGLGLLSTTNMLDPDLIVLGGGGIDAAGAIYEAELEAALARRIRFPNQRRTRVEISAAGSEVGAVGAASLLLHNAYAPRMSSAAEQSSPVATADSR